MAVLLKGNYALQPFMKQKKEPLDDGDVSGELAEHSVSR